METSLATAAPAAMAATAAANAPNTNKSLSSTSSANNATAAAAAKTADLNYDSFLKLLITQMKNQDPTDPMKASEQIAQLATFSQVGQTIRTNANLETLITGNALNLASNAIGGIMTSADGKTTGQVASIRVYKDSIVATTTDGNEIPVIAGITLGQPPVTIPQEKTDTDG